MKRREQPWHGAALSTFHFHNCQRARRKRKFVNKQVSCGILSFAEFHPKQLSYSLSRGLGGQTPKTPRRDIRRSAEKVRRISEFGDFELFTVRTPGRDGGCLTLTCRDSPGGFYVIMACLVTHPVPSPNARAGITLKWGPRWMRII